MQFNLIELFAFGYHFRCFFFGDISSKRDPTTYLTYIKALYDHYMEAEIQGAGLPLVINTPGWVKGLFFFILLQSKSSDISFLTAFSSP